MDKVALVHDFLLTAGGAEKVLATIWSIYKSPIFSFLYNQKVLEKLNITAEIYSSFFQKIPYSKKFHRLMFPFLPLIIEQFDLSNYDLIISSSYLAAKGVNVKSSQVHICYCHTPMRYIWDLYFLYLRSIPVSFRPLYRLISHYLRIWDVTSSNRVDYFVSNSNYVANRIFKIYRRESEVIYPPVDVKSIPFFEEKEDYYVVVSRLVEYKRVDVIVKAFSKLPRKRLFIIGEGPAFKKLKKIAGDNIKFLGWLTEKELYSIVGKARGFVTAAEEDFGISTVEALACGTPVIGYGVGGTSEIVEDFEEGVLFWNQEAEEIIKAIYKFENLSFFPKKLRNKALKFDREVFIEKFKKFVDSVI